MNPLLKNICILYHSWKCANDFFFITVNNYRSFAVFRCKCATGQLDVTVYTSTLQPGPPSLCLGHCRVLRAYLGHCRVLRPPSLCLGHCRVLRACLGHCRVLRACLGHFRVLRACLGHFRVLRACLGHCRVLRACLGHCRVLRACLGHCRVLRACLGHCRVLRASLIMLGTLQPRALGVLNLADPSISKHNPYVETSLQFGDSLLPSWFWCQLLEPY